MKKKYLFLMVLATFLLVITGCSSDGEKTMTCSRTMNQSDMKTVLNYTIHYKGNYVTSVNSIETIEMDDISTLEAYKEQVEDIYSPYQGIDYYVYNVDINDNKLTSTVDIDYEKIDTDKLIEIDSANGNLIKDGRINIDDMKSVYEQIGASCQ